MRTVLWILMIAPIFFLTLFLPLYHGDHAYQMLFGVFTLGAYCGYRLRRVHKNVVVRGLLLSLTIIYAVPVLFVLVFVAYSRIAGFFAGPW